MPKPQIYQRIPPGLDYQCRAARTRGWAMGGEGKLLPQKNQRQTKKTGGESGQNMTLLQTRTCSKHNTRSR